MFKIFGLDYRNGVIYLSILCAVMIGGIRQAAGQQAPSVPERHFQEGYRLYEQGLYQQAADQFQTYIRQNQAPLNELALTASYYRVRSMAQLDSTNTPFYFNQFIHSHPNSRLSINLLVELGHRNFKQKNYQQAITYYDRALKHHPDTGRTAKIYYWMAEAAASNGAYDQARQYYKMLADSLPGSGWSPKALYARGRLFLKQNKYAASSEAFELLRKRYPNREVTRRIETALGESYYRQEKYKQAVDALKNAMPYLEDRLRSKAAYLIAESYNYLGKYDKASAYYLRYINWNKGTPRERLAHYGLGWVYYKQDIYHWAAEQFSKAASGTDTLAHKALYYQGVMNKLGGRYREALHNFRQYGKQFEDGFWKEHAYYEWAITAYEIGRYSEAIEVLLKLVRSEEKLQLADQIYTLLGEAYFANGEYSRAIEAFERAEQLVDVKPSVKREARFQKAWVQFRNQAYQQAQPIFEQVYEEAPNTKIGAEALFWNANSYYNMKEFEEAARLFDKFTDRFPDHEMAGAAFYSLGWSYFEMSSYKEAVAPFKTFLNEYEPPSRALFPYNTDTQLRLGDSYYATGAFQKAINYYKKALGAEPGGDYAMYQIANAHYRAGNTYEAVKTFRKLLRIYPHTELREQAQYNIAYVYFLNNNYEQAIEEFKTVIKKYPNTSWAARAQYSIGDAYYNAGMYKKAIEAYKKVLKQYPNSEYLIDAVNGIQYAQTAAGREDTSNEVLQAFLNAHPRSGMADRLRYRQAENLMQSGQYKEAIDRFKQYLRVTNSEELVPEAHYNMGEIYQQLGKKGKAVEQYTTVVERFPRSAEAAQALASLGRIAFEHEQYEQAFEYYKKLRDKGGSYRIEGLVGLGRIALARGNVDQAETYFDSAMKIDSNNVTARIGKARVMYQKGQFDKAAQLFKQISEEYSTGVGAEAQYWLAMTYKKRNRCKKAVEAFSKVEVFYSPFDRWVARAKLGKARCQISLGEAGKARKTLQNLIQNYENTQPAQQARKLLDKQKR